METWLRILLIAVGFMLGFFGIFTALRIKQVAGYYECPHRQKKGWQEKTISKE